MSHFQEGSLFHIYRKIWQIRQHHNLYTTTHAHVSGIFKIFNNYKIVFKILTFCLKVCQRWSIFSRKNWHPLIPSNIFGIKSRLSEMGRCWSLEGLIGISHMRIRIFGHIYLYDLCFQITKRNICFERKFNFFSSWSNLAQISSFK